MICTRIRVLVASLKWLTIGQNDLQYRSSLDEMLCGRLKLLFIPAGHWTKPYWIVDTAPLQATQAQRNLGRTMLSTRNDATNRRAHDRSRRCLFLTAVEAPQVQSVPTRVRAARVVCQREMEACIARGGISHVLSQVEGHPMHPGTVGLLSFIDWNWTRCRRGHRSRTHLDRSRHGPTVHTMRCGGLPAKRRLI